MDGYMAAVRSHLVDHGQDVLLFNHETLKRARKGAINLFRKQKRPRNHISIQQLRLLTNAIVTAKSDLNKRAAYLLTFAGFLRSGEICWNKDDWANQTVFQATKATRRDIVFSENYDRVTFTLKSSKTDANHAGVKIMVAANPDITICPVTAMRILFRDDPQHLDSPLFSLDGQPFTRVKLQEGLQNRLLSLGINPQGLSGHSFRKGAAQYAADCGLAENEIQLLGRWSSEAFRLYFKRDARQLYNLNFQFQTSRLPAYDSSFVTTELGPPTVGLDAGSSSLGC